MEQANLPAAMATAPGTADAHTCMGLCYVQGLTDNTKIYEKLVGKAGPETVSFVPKLSIYPLHLNFCQCSVLINSAAL